MSVTSVHRRIAGLVLLASLAAVSGWRALPTAPEVWPACPGVAGVTWPGGRALVCFDARRIRREIVESQLGLLPEQTARLPHWFEAGQQVRLAEDGGFLVGPLSAQDRLVIGCRVDLNAMSRADLERLPGVGPRLAQRIVTYRERVGRFATVRQLLEVRGIGPRTVGRLMPLLGVPPDGSLAATGFPCPPE